MKKLFALLLALVMVLSLTACGGGRTEAPAAAPAAPAEKPAENNAAAPEAPAAEAEAGPYHRQHIRPVRLRPHQLS